MDILNNGNKAKSLYMVLLMIYIIDTSKYVLSETPFKWC